MVKRKPIRAVVATAVMMISKRLFLTGEAAWASAGVKSRGCDHFSAGAPLNGRIGSGTRGVTVKTTTKESTGSKRHHNRVVFN